MRQCKVGEKGAPLLSGEEMDHLLRDVRYTTGAGTLYPVVTTKMFGHSPEENTRHLDQCYEQSGFLLTTCYLDITTDLEAGKFAYADWQKRTSKRVKDPFKRNLLVPKVEPHQATQSRARLLRAGTSVTFSVVIILTASGQCADLCP